MKDLIMSTHQRALNIGPPNYTALVGFDGFVDQIVRAVDKRIDFERYTPIETITDFSERIARAAGMSTNIEFVPTQLKLGGNGPIMANALTEIGFQVTYIGSLGKDSIHPVFQDLADRCTTYSIADPGTTDALEFTDGKLMLGITETMKDITWQAIVDSVGFDGLRDLFETVDLVALVDWTLIPYATSIWQSITRELLPHVSIRQPKPWLFVDIADPEKRDPSEVAEAVQHLKEFNTHFRTVLGLNRKEATEVANALHLDLGIGASEADLSVIVPAIGKHLGLHGVVVHPTDRAAGYFGEEYNMITGPHTARPTLTTGAGDNFNAGFSIGLVMGLTPEQAMIMGKGTSGFYVRNGKSPTWAELLQFLKTWADNVGDDF